MAAIASTTAASGIAGNGTMIFKAIAGEKFSSRDLKFVAEKQSGGFVLIEPNVPQYKSVAPNKTWPLPRYQEVARRLTNEGLEVRQFDYPGGQKLAGVQAISAPTFRHALAVLSRAALYVGPEGGLHHGSAAVGARAVVLFGGFIPPRVTGYDTHINLTGGAEACGSLQRCQHCADAMAAISVEEVEAACRSMLAAG
jgi:ADP-heptose:LPS heptosyltransferase